jgi:hypothetical protein
MKLSFFPSLSPLSLNSSSKLRMMINSRGQVDLFVSLIQEQGDEEQKEGRQRRGKERHNVMDRVKTRELSLSLSSFLPHEELVEEIVRPVPSPSLIRFETMTPTTGR